MKFHINSSLIIKAIWEACLFQKNNSSIFPIVSTCKLPPFKRVLNHYTTFRSALCPLHNAGKA